MELESLVGDIADIVNCQKSSYIALHEHSVGMLSYDNIWAKALFVHNRVQGWIHRMWEYSETVIRSSAFVLIIWLTSKPNALFKRNDFTQSGRNETQTKPVSQ